MIILLGPHCFVCGGSNVVRREVKGPVAWTERGTVEGKVMRDFCLDCEAALAASQKKGE